MEAPSVRNGEYPIPLHTETIVRRLDLFPELVRALHDGDLLTGRLFCAKLFDCDARRNLLREGTPTLEVPEGEGVKQQSGNEAEDGGIGANAQPQRQHPDGGESRIPSEHPRRVSQILCDGRQRLKII
jgi:hypothetical protein